MENNNESARLMGKRPIWPTVLLISLLVIGGFAALVYYGFKKVDVNVSNGGQEATKGAEQEVVNISDTTIKNIQEITSSRNMASFIDRKAEFEGVTVKSIGTNNMVFWINDTGATSTDQTQGRDLFVYMNRELEAQVYRAVQFLNDGQKINISGTITPLPDESVIRDQWKLNEDDTTYLKDKLIYLDAESVVTVQ